MRWFHRTGMVIALIPLTMLSCRYGESEYVDVRDRPVDEPVVATAPEVEPAPVDPAPVEPDPTPPVEVAVAPPTPEPAPEPVAPAGYVASPIITDVLTMGNEDPVLKLFADEAETDTGFASNAFPPTMSDTEWHNDSWLIDDCMRCHETGVMGGPVVRHRGMPDVLVAAKCRSCHVLIPGDDENAIILPADDEDDAFEEYAFPPMIPNSTVHLNTWTSDRCLTCHEDGLSGAPKVKHESEFLPSLLLKVKCRSCHVQVRAIESVPNHRE